MRKLVLFARIVAACCVLAGVAVWMANGSRHDRTAQVVGSDSAANPSIARLPRELPATDSSSKLHVVTRTRSGTRKSSDGFPQVPEVLRLPLPENLELLTGDGRQVFSRESGTSTIALCQFTVAHPHLQQQPSSPKTTEPRWHGGFPVAGEEYAQGEYIGPARTPHVNDYRLRVDDQLDFVYRFTHEEIAEAYRLVVGDELIIESFPQDTTDAIRRGDINQGRALTIQPDGTLRLPLINSLSVVGKTLDELERDLEDRYSKFFTDPNFTVTPWKTNTKLEDLRSAVDARFGSGGQSRSATVTPDGKVQLVGIGSVGAQGLTLDELQEETNARYVELVGRGVEVTAILRQRAPRYVWVVGEVLQPGQFEMKQPMTVVQALALSNGFLNGGNVREIIVFRRDDNWQLMATRLDVRGVFVGRTPFPSDNIWLRDNDIVVVPKSPIQRIDEFIDLVFTRGIYGVVPFSANYTINNVSRL